MTLATDSQADLIVVGNGKSTLQRLLLGGWCFSRGSVRLSGHA
jgi:ABC-type protease/lipase transport system fused ATPase/permease subunit